ncbi:MAG: DUF1573 domain-containing protein [Bacteroidetes bacterium]|nr:MAG: DUF1573 domain-containing protein [Bacteroidota bacterium]
MKRYLFIALWLVGSVVMAQDKKPLPAGTTTVQSVPLPYPNAPEITFTKSEHDFGTLKKGQSVTCKFEYKNTGKEDLIISNCRAGCECTTAKCVKDPVKPGKTGFIEVHYDSTRVGKFGKEVMVHSNARKPLVFLLIKGIIEDSDVSVKNEDALKTPVEKKTE